MNAPSTAVAKREPSNFEVELNEREPQFLAALPAHIPVERFKRVIITAVNQNQDLAAADRRTFFTACVRAAQDGLLPDGREAALVIFNTKVKRHGREEWVKAVQYMPMIHGIRKRMRNTKEVASADAQVVYENDHFDYELGDNPRIEHKPTLGERGRPIGAYAIIKLTNGEVLREVMSVGEIEHVRAVSRSKDKGPWVDWWTEMARKTVLRRCSKAAPTSSDLDTLMRRDEESPIEEHATVTAIPQRPRRADFSQPPAEREVEAETESSEFAGDIANEVASETPHDPETGEVHEDRAEPSPAHGNGADAPIAHAGAPQGTGAAAPQPSSTMADSTPEERRTPAQATPAPAPHKAEGHVKAGGDLLGGRPAESKPATGKAPNSPLAKTGPKGNWGAFTPWFLGQLRAIPAEQISEFIAAHSGACDYFAENQTDVWDEAQTIMDARRG